MNKIKLYIIYTIFVLTGIFTISCSDFLDKQPDDAITIEEVFKSRIETDKYLRNVYNYLPDEISIVYLTDFTYMGADDDGDVTYVWSQSNNMNTGNWSPLSVSFNDFTHLYRGIRSASVFMSRVDECIECEDYKTGSTGVYKAEARVLRAWYYYLLMRKFGPVVLVKNILPVDADVSLTTIPRNSFDECVNYIVSELDEAQAVLPLALESEKDYGRVDQKVALAMKSRILLYAASPLWNGNTDFSNFKNADGKPLVNTTYDASKWQKAAQASKALIDLMPEGLYKKNTNGVLDPFLSYRDLFFDRWNKEVIWARPTNNSGGFEKHVAPRQTSSYNGFSVTQSLVDAYQMDNGLRIMDPGSGYVETGFSIANTKYTKAGDWNMYVGREPRFYTTVLYNGDIWPFVGNGTIKVELFATGLSGKNGSHDYSKTGYLMTKFSSPQTDAQNYNFAQQAFITFRLGEIYLNYAEALNEFSPGDPDIAKYVDLVRERAGLPGLPNGLTQTQMRDRIRLERRLELAFEGHRLFDVRRWKIAEQTENGPMYGMNVSNGTSFSDPSFYQRTVFETRVFNKKHYLWPIPQSEIDRNKEMVQNPGW